MLPPKIIERLRLGRGVAAEITPSRPENRAWIHVKPIIDPQLGKMQQREPVLEPLLQSFGGASPIVGYQVRHRELHRAFEDSPDDWDLIGLSVDETYLVRGEDELALLLRKWLADFNVLTLPHNVDHPF